jgi:hypothetical protein
MEAVSSIRNLRTRHALVTEDPRNVDLEKLAGGIKRSNVVFS